MIGEIRDLETAQIAVQASLTGHLVFATLHTNDAVSAVTPARRHGRGAISACLKPDRGWARSAWCAGCAWNAASPLRPTRHNCGRLAWHRRWNLYSAQGCAACNRSGYRGRTGIYELLTVDDDLRPIDPRPCRRARAAGACRFPAACVHCADDGMRWAAQGVISLR